MSDVLDMSAWTAVVLAGGSGTRLREVCPDTPKPLIPVLGRPFLDWLLTSLQACGFCRAIISTGYCADQFGPYHGHERIPGLELSTVPEREALGTAGGFCHAVVTAKLKNNLVALNGDSLVLMPLQPVLRDFAQHSAPAAIVAVPVEDASRYGTLDLDASGWVRGFREKQPGAGIANAGIYLFRESVIAHFPEKRPLSFEAEVFPHLIASRLAIRAYPCAAPFLDIGIPEALAQAPAFLNSHFEAFLRQAQS
jgi:D-glycero-alpha-D-manno-heptose 1-phosphate guanylyltransferase